MRRLLFLFLALFVCISYADVAPVNVRNVYSTTNVTTAAWVELIASTPNNLTQMYIFDSSGKTLMLGEGASGFETNLMLIVPGGNGHVLQNISAGKRISIKAVSGTASAGELDAIFIY